MSKQANVSKRTLWGVIGSGVIIVGLALVSPLGAYLRSAIVGPDINAAYRPLVRHQKSQVHCYDNGSQFCESRTQPFTKEFTIGYLAAPGAKPVSSIGTAMLYSCANQAKGKFYLTLNKAECGKGSGHASTIALGHVFSQPGVEAPVALYRCLNDDRTDALATDDPNECALVGYHQPEMLGYVAGAGYLAQRRLEDLCTSINTACAQGGASASLCQQRLAFCAPTPTP